MPIRQRKIYQSKWKRIFDDFLRTGQSQCELPWDPVCYSTPSTLYKSARNAAVALNMPLSVVWHHARIYLERWPDVALPGEWVEVGRVCVEDEEQTVLVYDRALGFRTAHALGSLWSTESGEVLRNVSHVMLLPELPASVVEA